MKSLRLYAAILAILLGFAGADALAQTAAPQPDPADAAKAAPKGARTAPAKPAAKDASKTPAKAAAKDASKTPAKSPPKKQLTKVYTTAPPVLRDKDGNVIPTHPDAYNVDSALPKKK